MGHFIKKDIIIIFLLLYASSILAINKTPPTPKPGDVIPPGLCIDAGLSFLLILGTAFGVHKLKNK